MNSLIFYLVIITATPNDTLCRARFYGEATKDTSVLSAYLKLEINDSTGNKTEVLIPNYSLYSFFKLHYGMNYEEYRKYINNFYKSRQVLKYSEYSELSTYAVLLKNDYVERVAKKGKKKFISHFFEHSVFKFKYQKYFEMVVGRLFDYGVLVSRIEDADVIFYTAECF
ncbi:MAG TPA: hypothetical protein VK645_20005 [Chitinophagaceae bacterium]|nr:hypothetical protein [Chitinophagaceae bacterium]